MPACAASTWNIPPLPQADAQLDAAAGPPPQTGGPLDADRRPGLYTAPPGACRRHRPTPAVGTASATSQAHVCACTPYCRCCCARAYQPTRRNPVAARRAALAGAAPAPRLLSGRPQNRQSRVTPPQMHRCLLPQLNHKPSAAILYFLLDLNVARTVQPVIPRFQFRQGTCNRPRSDHEQLGLGLISNYKYPGNPYDFRLWYSSPIPSAQCPRSRAQRTPSGQNWPRFEPAPANHSQKLVRK